VRQTDFIEKLPLPTVPISDSKPTIFNGVQGPTIVSAVETTLVAITNSHLHEPKHSEELRVLRVTRAGKLFALATAGDANESLRRARELEEKDYL